MCLAALTLAACIKEQTGATPGATLGTAAPTTTTTDPYAIPNPIDAAYVNRILAGLDAVIGDVVRMMVATKTIPREAFDRVKAIHATDAILNRVLDSLSKDVAFRLNQYKPQPGNRASTVTDMISAKRSCIFAKVARDYSAVSASPNAAITSQWVVLVPRDPNRDPSQYNQTGWSFVYDGFEGNLGPPGGDPCAGY